MTIAEVAAEAGAEVEDEAAGVLLPGEATVASGREAEGGHPHPIMCPETDTRPQLPMTETDTSHAPGPGHPPQESTDP